MSAAEIQSSAFETLYGELYPLLVNVGVSKFGIAEDDSRALANEVFVDYLSKSDRVYSHRSFLVAAMCNASRYYLRVQARTTSLPEEEPHRVERGDVTDALAAKQALDCLTPRCQFALRLRYFEGYTVPEIAAEFRTSVKYAEKVVRECLRQAQRRYVGREV
jgi:RNA polymerase sigma factor (sigma-70 family)